MDSLSLQGLGKQIEGDQDQKTLREERKKESGKVCFHYVQQKQQLATENAHVKGKKTQDI